jgi:hypothetical protein
MEALGESFLEEQYAVTEGKSPGLLVCRNAGWKWLRQQVVQVFRETGVKFAAKLVQVFGRTPCLIDVAVLRRLEMLRSESVCERAQLRAREQKAETVLLCRTRADSARPLSLLRFHSRMAGVPATFTPAQFSPEISFGNLQCATQS